MSKDESVVEMAWKILQQGDTILPIQLNPLEHRSSISLARLHRGKIPIAR